MKNSDNDYYKGYDSGSMRDKVSVAIREYASGHGSRYGSGSGCGSVEESDSGDGSGSGYGFGSGNGNGSGSGDGEGYVDGSGGKVNT
jgi:hypothetical protein